MFRANWIQLDRMALKANLQLLQQWNGPDFFCPMVKANAYGHGALLVAHVVQEVGASALGVALVEEGLALRAGGIELPILVFAPFCRSAASAMLTHRLTPVVTRMADLHALESLKWKSTLPVHLKFNTGMCRLGFDESDLPSLRRWLKDNPNLKIEGVCTHLIYGDDAPGPESASDRQLQQLVQMSEGFSGVRHAHKSASLCTRATLGLKKISGVGARPGISMYGLPHEGASVGPGLKPVLQWHSRLMHVHTIKVGEGVSYGATWRAARPSVIGVVPVGYGDGYMRALSNQVFALYRGQRVKNVGTVCMDYTMFDLTDAAKAGAPALGDEIVLIGRQGDAEIKAGELAEAVGTIAYEVVTAIRERVARKVE